MDIADSAEHQEEQARRMALLVRKKPGPEFTGLCANCEANLGPTMRWCDADCRDDWVKREGQ